MDNIRDSMEEGLYKAMFQKIVSVLTTIVLVTICLFGCARTRPTVQQKQSEILESGNRAAERARHRADNFINCTIRYAQENYQVSATVSEVAEAALSICQYDLDLYKMARSQYHFCMDGVNARSVSGVQLISEKADEKARLDAQDLAQRAKGLIINRLIKMRQ